MGEMRVAQMLKNPPAMQEAQVRSLGQEDPQEKGMAIHSGILAWRGRKVSMRTGGAQWVWGAKAALAVELPSQDPLQRTLRTFSEI